MLVLVIAKHVHMHACVYACCLSSDPGLGTTFAPVFVSGRGHVTKTLESRARCCSHMNWPAQQRGLLKLHGNFLHILDKHVLAMFDQGW